MSALSSVPLSSVASEYSGSAEADRIAALKQELAAAGVEYCFATFCDVHGIPKAKATPIGAFEEMCEGGELYTVGALEGMGLHGPHEDECATIPDLESMIVCPWDRRQVWFASDLYYHGGPYPNDPRGMLKRVLAQAADMGFRLNLGIEPEFYILSKDPQAGGYAPITSSRFRGPNACYDYNLTDESLSVLGPLARALTDLGWGLFSFDQECGKGQYEFDFGYTDALTMSDRFIFLRTLVKKVAQQAGAVASFMPKPFADDFRNGAHFNMSLADIEGGDNLFAPRPGEDNPFAERYGVRMSKLAYHFAAGVLKHAPAITAVACPTYNSYQGLIAQGALAEFSWAPILMAYGRNNRSAMLRFPMNRHCIENRTVDMSVNPYLCAALTLAAGLEGIEQELDPGEPLNADLYKLSMAEIERRGVRRLPPTLLHALEAFAADPLTQETFGPFKDIYLAYKQKEWERGFYRVTDDQRTEKLEFL